MEDQLNL